MSTKIAYVKIGERLHVWPLSMALNYPEKIVKR